MLEHVVKAKVLDLVLSRVDLVVRVLEVALDNKRRGVACLAGACMIRTCISALSQHIRDVAILGDDFYYEVGQAFVDIISDDSNGLRLAIVQGLLDVASLRCTIRSRHNRRAMLPVRLPCPAEALP